jgi:4Fe-4S ferredoxin
MEENRMPMKELKTESENELTIERRLHVKRYSLTLNKTRCPGCGICVEVCPREAIELKKVPKVEGEKAKPPFVDFDEKKCQYCGICNTLCPFGALDHRVNGEPWVAVVDIESFPQLIREIEVDPTKCDVNCVDCEEACPLNLIKVTVRTPDGQEVKDIESISDKENLTVDVDITKELCPCCRICEVKCPKGAIHVRKIFHGIININREKCPEGCQDCLDVCPILGALYLSEEDGKVHVNELFCVYCGVCKIVCPVEGALELERTYIHHTPISSGAWNKALEKLTSTKGMMKELRAKGYGRTQKSVKKRLGGRSA